MKKLFTLLFVALLGSFDAYSQSVTASQIKKKTNAGVVADSANAIAVGVYQATSAPGTPVTGQLWCDTTTTPCTLKTYNGATWGVTPNTSSVPVADTLASFPGSPSDGQMFYTRYPRVLWIYDSTAAKWIGGASLASATSYNIAQETYSPTQTLATPTGTITNMAYSASASGGIRSGYTFSFKYTCVTATGGETLASPVSATYTSNTATGAVSMTVPVCADAAAKRFIYGTKENTAVTGPWYQIGVLNDNSTTAFTWKTYDWGAANSNWLSNNDSAYGNIEPAQAFTGTLPASYVIWNGLAALYTVNSHPEYFGGCGVTANSQIYCRNSITGSYSSTHLTDNYAALRRDLSSYAIQNYVIQYRLTYGTRPPTDSSIFIYDGIGGMVEKNQHGTRGFVFYNYNCGNACSFSNVALLSRYIEGATKLSGINATPAIGYPRTNRTTGHSLYVRIYHYYSGGAHVYYIAFSHDNSIWTGTTYNYAFSHTGKPLNYLEVAFQSYMDSVNWGGERGGAFTFDQFSLTILP